MKTNTSIEILETRIAPAGVPFASIASDLKTELDSIQLTIDAAFAVASLLPVVGDKIADAGKVIDNFSTQLRDALSVLGDFSPDVAVQNAIYQVLGSPGLNILGDYDMLNGVTPMDIVITHPLGAFLIDLNLHASVALTKDVEFKIGLDALPIEVEANAGVSLSASIDYNHLKFGYVDGEFSFDTTAQDELQISVAAGLKAGSEIKATFGFLSATIKDGTFNNSGAHTQLSASLTVDVGAGDTSFAKNFTVSADIALQIDASVDPSFPGIGADFVMHYSGFTAADAAPTVDFKNVRVNLGGILNNIIKPVFEIVKPIVEPLTPIIDFVTAPIPVLSDLSHAIGFGDITLLGIAELAGNKLPPDYQAIVQLTAKVVEILDFVQMFQANPETGEISINFGNFSALSAGDSSEDLRNVQKALKLGDALANGKDLSGLTPAGLGDIDVNGMIDSAVAELPKEAQGVVGDLVQPLKDMLDDFLHPNGITYAFPFLSNPGESVFGMFLGRDADLFTLDAKVKISEQFNESYPVGFGVEVAFTGGIALDLQLHLGYDTFGLRQFVTHLINDDPAHPATPVDFLDGFHFADNDDPINNTHAYLDANIGVSAGIDIIIASVEVEGGIKLGIHIVPPTNINDMDGDDSKLHLRPELTDCLLETEGGLDAYLTVELTAGISPFAIHKTFEIARVNLLDFSGGCIANPFTPPDQLQLASTHADDNSVPAGTLRLNIGDFANQRGINNLAIDNPLFPNESYQIFPGVKPGEVTVFAFGFTQTFSGIDTIIGDGKAGDDSIIFSASDSATLPSPKVIIHGGVGNDQLVYDGPGNATLFGDGGDDILQGGRGTNYLNGGDGNDRLVGGKGTNHLGAFNLQGLVFTEHGNDTLTGGEGLNTIDGDDGDDALFAGPTNGDMLFGGRGNDQFVANFGTSSFIGAAGDDSFIWKHGDGKPTLLDGGSDVRENNTLLITGSENEDTFSIARKSGDTQIRLGVQTGANSAFTFDAHAIHDVVIEGGKGLDTMTVFPLIGTAVRNVGLNLNDILNDKVGHNDNAVDIIKVIGTGFADTVMIQAEQVAIAPGIHDNFILGGVMKVSGLQTYTVRLANVDDDFTYNAAGGNDSTTLLSNTGPTRLLGSLGNDSFTIAAAKLGNLADPLDPANPKDYIGTVTVDAGAGVNKITFDESASEIADTILFGQTQFYSKLISVVPFVATGGNFKGGVTVKGGQFADDITLAGTLMGVTTSILSGAGSDMINIGGVNGSSGNLDAIRGPINIDAGFGANQLLLVDVNDTDGNAHAAITASQVLKLAGVNDEQSISYAANGGTLGITIEGSNTGADVFTLTSPSADLNVRGNGGNDSVKVTALAPTNNLAFSGGQGDDSVTLGTGIHKLDGFTSLVSFHGDAGSDTLTLDDAANLVQRNFDINAASFSFTGANGTGSVDADSALEIANVLGGKFGTTFHVKTSNILVGKVNIDGTAGNDVVEGPDAESIWNVTNTNAGVLNGNVNFIRTPNLFGGSKSDRFVFANGKGVTGSILGDPGNAFGSAVADTLDYSAFTTGVTVNLKTGKASNVGGSIDAIENVTGGLAGDVIVGNNIANIILGGTGRDVLIGGLGADAITAGADEDLLIGGTTDFDTDAVAMQAIAQAWRGAGDYLHRIAKLTTTGVGLGNAIKLTAGTVHNDLTTDTLFGGEDRQDWFFAHLAVGGPLPGIDVTDFSIENERNG